MFLIRTNILIYMYPMIETVKYHCETYKACFGPIFQINNFRYMREGDMIPVMRAARELIARVNPSEEEMIVVAVFMFWTIGRLIQCN